MPGQVRKASRYVSHPRGHVLREEDRVAPCSLCMHLHSPLVCISYTGIVPHPFCILILDTSCTIFSSTGLSLCLLHKSQGADPFLVSHTEITA